MLKAWDEHSRLLIMGLTFDPQRKLSNPIQNFVMLRRKDTGAANDVVLITAANRDIIAESLKLSQRNIIATHSDPIWYFMRTKNDNHVVHVCLSQDELLTLRLKPMLGFYRLSGAHIGASFDTIMIGGPSEVEMVQFLKRIAMIGETTRVELDTIKVQI